VDCAALNQLHTLVHQGQYTSVREAAVDFVQYARTRGATGDLFDAAQSQLRNCSWKDLGQSGGRLSDWFNDFLSRPEIQPEFDAFLRFRAFPQNTFDQFGSQHNHTVRS